MTDAYPTEHWRTLDAPFTADGWQPTPGTCSRCGQPAWRGQHIWWHQDQPCPSRGRPAAFLPD